MHPTCSGLTFIVNGPARTIVVPGSYGVPTIAAQRQCRMLIDTVAIDGKGLADTWRVTAIARNGCG